MSKIFKKEIGGKELVIETGHFALQANGSVTVRQGDTVVLATVVMSPYIRKEISYFPLMVDYEEKLYAAGKIKGSRFIKREGRPSDEAVITARVVDRCIRPLFPQHIPNDIQVVINVFSFDNENDPDVLAIIGASAAIAISDIPFAQTIGAVRVGRLNGELALNPALKTRSQSDLDLIVSATKEKKVIMLESSSINVGEEDFFAAIQFGKKYITSVIELIEEIQKAVGKKKMEVPKPELETKIKEELKSKYADQINKVLYLDQRLDRKRNLHDLIDEAGEQYGEEIEKQVKDYLTELAEDLIQENILKNNKRIGDRRLDQIRPLDVNAHLFPRIHGTGYFLRGETQVSSFLTLGAPSDEQIIDDLEDEYKKRFMHHYNFPPFSVGETQPLRGPSRRDIGHGALVESALERLIPSKEVFPYTIRIVSEVLGSNGSSSMASTCASSLALMDAGVPFKEHVAGIAMGLVSNEQGDFKILTDLQDLEDSNGGMDFKIAGTKNYITAVQLDTKTHGLTDEMVKQTLEQAKKARLEIIAKMETVITQPRPELSPYAPRLVTLQINPDKIRDVIGPGGKVINKIIADTGVEIDIEDSGLVTVCSTNAEGVQKAIARIKELTREAKIGEEFSGRVTRVMTFGIFVEVLPGIEGLVHSTKLPRPHHFKVGDQVNVKVVEIDNQGRVNLGLSK